MSSDDLDAYDVPEDLEDVDRLSQIFAPAHVEEWDLAVLHLREILETLEDADLRDSHERREAEEALFNELEDAEIALRDAWDTRVNEDEVIEP